MGDELITVCCPRCGRALGFEQEVNGVSLLETNGFLIKNVTAVCPCGELLHWSMSDKALLKAAQSLRVPEPKIHVVILGDIEPA